jgi:hypothetical protein
VLSATTQPVLVASEGICVADGPVLASRNDISLEGLRVTNSEGRRSLAKLVLLSERPHQISHFFLSFSRSSSSSASASWLLQNGLNAVLG